MKKEKVYIMQESDCQRLENVTIKREDGTIAFCGKPDACFVSIIMKDEKGRHGIVVRSLDEEAHTGAIDEIMSMHHIEESLEDYKNNLKKAIAFETVRGIANLLKKKDEEDEENEEEDEENED